MKLIKVLPWVLWSLVFTLTALPGLAADYPAPQEGSWVVRDFRFHTGEVLPELRLHYTTVGAHAPAPPSHDCGCAHRCASAHPARHDPIGRRHAQPRVRRRTLRPRAAAR